MSTQETLLLFDVHSLMNRAFYGIAGHSRLTAPDGFPTGALFAFLNMILKYKEELDPSHIVSAMDMPGDTFRHDQYEDYKAGRSPMPEDLAKQLPLARDLLEALGFQPVGLDRYEADDLIGTMAARAEAAGMKVFIVTGDRDSLQLVSDQTSVVFLSSKKTGSTSEIVDPDNMRQDYGVSPDQWVHMKALMGDSSDNIPGVKGVGAKTALRLIQAYGSLDGVYDHLDQEKGALLRNLQEGKEKAYLSLDLSRIDRQVPLAQADELLHETSSHLRDDDKLAALLLQLDFRSHLERLGLEGQAAKERPEIKVLEDLDAFFQTSQGETSFAFFLPDQDGEGLLASQEACVRIKDPKALDPLLEDPRLTLISWDVKKQLRKTGRQAPGKAPADIMINAYLLNQLGRGDDMGFALRAILGPDFQPLSQEALPLFQDDWNERKEAAVQFPAAWKKQMAAIKARGLERLQSVETILVGILADMERKGVLIDLPALDKASADMEAELEDLERAIYQQAGRPFNINSPQQLAEILYEDLQLPKGRKGSSGQYSTAADELERLKGSHDIIGNILDYREFSKLRGTFLEGLKKEIAKDGRVHTSYNQTIVATGRLSSSNPNLQNIPIRTDRGSQIRELFIAPPGYVLIGADYSQIELRLLAHLSGDRNLTRAFLEGRDVHKVTASTLFGKEESQISPRERAVAKTVNFSITYGISDFGLSRDLDIPIPEARQLINRYHALYPGVEAWMKAIGEKAKEDGYVETLFGRRRYVPELQSQNRNTYNFGMRAAMNAPVQGTAADLIKMAMVDADRALKAQGLDGAIILQVHDELILEVAEKDQDKAQALLKEAMEAAVSLDVPLVAGSKSGRTWGDLK